MERNDQLLSTPLVTQDYETIQRKVKSQIKVSVNHANRLTEKVRLKQLENQVKGQLIQCSWKQKQRRESVSQQCPRRLSQDSTSSLRLKILSSGRSALRSPVSRRKGPKKQRSPYAEDLVNASVLKDFPKHSTMKRRKDPFSFSENDPRNYAPQLISRSSSMSKLSVHADHPPVGMRIPPLKLTKLATKLKAAEVKPSNPHQLEKIYLQVPLHVKHIRKRRQIEKLRLERPFPYEESLYRLDRIKDQLLQFTETEIKAVLGKVDYSIHDRYVLNAWSLLTKRQAHHHVPSILGNIFSYRVILEQLGARVVLQALDAAIGNLDRPFQSASIRCFDQARNALLCASRVKQSLQPRCNATKGDASKTGLQTQPTWIRFITFIASWCRTVLKVYRFKVKHHVSSTPRESGCQSRRNSEEQGGSTGVSSQRSTTTKNVEGSRSARTESIDESHSATSKHTEDTAFSPGSSFEDESSLNEVSSACDGTMTDGETVGVRSSLNELCSPSVCSNTDTEVVEGSIGMEVSKSSVPLASDAESEHLSQLKSIIEEALLEPLEKSSSK